MEHDQRHEERRRGVAGISFLTAGTAVLGLFFGWNSWLSNAVINEKAQTAAIIATMKDIQDTVHELKDTETRGTGIATSTSISKR